MFFSKLRTNVEEPVQERRRSIRHTTVMQIAKIRLAGAQEELCLLRDVSPEGLKAEIYVPVEMGTRVEIEVRTGHMLSGCVTWAEPDLIGVAFDEPMPMAAMLAHCSFDERVGKLRPPRLSVDMNGLLKLGAEDRPVRVGNVSQAGVQIGVPAPLHPGAPCAIALPGLPPRAATIRWCRGDQAGLQLSEPFDYTEFAEWRAIVAA